MNDDFFSGFFASLRLRGATFIDTRGGAHHARFREVAGALEAAHKSGVPGIEGLPLLFRPSPVTGQYGEFDDALIRMQEGIAASPNPYYPGLSLTLSEQQARDILMDFSPGEQRELDELATIYLAKRSDDTVQAALAASA